MNIIDIVLILVVALSVVLAIKKGLLRSIVELAGFLLGVPASMALAKAIAPSIYSNLFQQKLMDSTLEKINSYGDVSGFLSKIEDTIQSFPFSLEGLGRQFGVDINGTLSGMSAGLSNSAIAERYVDSILKPVITLLCTGVLFLLFFVLIIILVKIVSFLLKNSHLPHGLREANGALGAVMGLVKGAVLVFVACTILGAVQMGLSIKQEPSKFASTIASSFIVEKVNQFNPLFK